MGLGPAPLTNYLPRVPVHTTAGVEPGFQWEPSRPDKKVLV